MALDDNLREQEQKLEEMTYSPEQDIFNKEQPVEIDGDGNPILNENDIPPPSIGDILDVPGPEEDGQVEAIDLEDEENDYYSLSDNVDDHESENEDIIE